MATTFKNQYSAAALFDGGWRADDREELIAEYGLTDEEADAICAELAGFDAPKKYRVKEEHVATFYGNADAATIEDYQTNGIPEEDLEQLTREWGDLSDVLEEI